MSATATLTAAVPVLAPAPEPHDLLRRSEVAEMLRVNPRTVTKLRDRLKPLRISVGVWRWRRADVLRFIESLAVAG
jgi:hypothetical protein